MLKLFLQMLPKLEHHFNSSQSFSLEEPVLFGDELDEEGAEDNRA